jgi:serine/threonine protein kinase
MEYIPLTARQLLVRREVGLLRALRIGLNCLSALQSIHTADRPLIHRDIKPENILISEVGAKLADFGLVKELEDAGREEAPDEALEGTQWPGMPFRYRTPELVSRARGENVELTPASDIYQFGTVLYELLTTFNPQRSPEQIIDPISIDIRGIHGEFGGALTELLQDMLREDPAHRPTAASCLARLGSIHQDVCGRLASVTGVNH